MRPFRNFSIYFLLLILEVATGMPSLSACGGLSTLPFKSLLDEQPHVLEIQPSAESTLQDPIEIVVKFSHRIDIHHLNNQSIVFVKGPVEKNLLEDTRELLENLADEKINTLPIQTILDGEEQTLTVIPQIPLSSGRYYLMVTTALVSVDGVPFNQEPGNNPTMFVATYTYGDASDANPSDSTPGASENPFGPAPQTLVINEVLYDGQLSETDGEAFVELYGTPNADISLYQILWINGADGEEIDRVTLPIGTIIPQNGIFIIADLRTNSTNMTQVQNSNFLDQFDPQNGPDSVILLNREGILLDALTYGESAVELSATGIPLREGSVATDVGAGHSLSRINGVDTQDNSIDFVDLVIPTPGIP